MARTANKTANDMLVKLLVDDEIIDVSQYMFGHLIGVDADLSLSENENGSDPVALAAIDLAGDSVPAASQNLAIQSFSLDKEGTYLVANVTSGANILILTGARNTPVTPDALTYVYETVL